MVCQLAPTAPEVIQSIWEPWYPELPKNLPGRYIPYEAFIVTCPARPGYIQDTIFPANSRCNTPAYVTLNVTHEYCASPRQVQLFIYGWHWMLFDTLRGDLKEQWKLGLNIPSALNYDPSRNRWGVPWSKSMRSRMFGKGWIYRGWRGNVVNSIKDGLKKVMFCGEVRVPRKKTWKTGDGAEWTALDVSRLFSKNWKERRRLGRLWATVVIPCLCKGCEIARAWESKRARQLAKARGR
ncbi:hypothetical protein TWF718_003153 [Orbilia javanica]|uniref:Uncharacterized protein n=1 Tax=Orbilia javanica TaxID=47235 RepID=A0AAN8NLH5_9PEZI